MKSLAISNRILIVFFILIAQQVFSQNGKLIAYNNPPSGTLQNKEFTVKVRVPNGDWQDIFEYTAYVNCGPGKEQSCVSSFAYFDFEGIVEVSITSNNRDIDTILVRPLAKKINPLIDTDNKKLSFFLSDPSNLSIEINGDRYNNIHLFANELDSGAPLGATTVAEMNKNLEKRSSISGTGEARWYSPQDGETIYIGGDEIFKGSILIENKKNITILGRGVIDQSSFDKHYNRNSTPVDYDYLRGIEIQSGENIIIDGIIFNDTQHFNCRIYESNNITINNVKGFSRVIWGDGIHMVGTSNVTINNCFLRNSDDCIAIYAANVRTWGVYGGIAENILVTNTSLYADVVHPIEIGWHGLEITNPEKALVKNITFDRIDILEQDIPTPKWGGIMSVTCGDNSKCQDITFRNFNIEDITQGSLFTVRVETPGSSSAAYYDGHRIENIRFENITYNFSGSEELSVIKGLDDYKYVNGVHFKNIIINNKPVLVAEDYYKLSIDEVTAFDITFNKELKPATILKPSTATTFVNAIYKSKFDTIMLPKNFNIIPLTDKNGSYKIEVSDNAFLTLSDNELFDPLTGSYQGYMVDSDGWKDELNQKWFVNEENDGTLRIISAANKGYSLAINASDLALSLMPVAYIASPWKNKPLQRWMLNESNISEFIKNSILVSDTKIVIDRPEGFDDRYTIYLRDADNNILKSKRTRRESIKLRTKRMDEGVYFIEMNYGNIKTTSPLIVSH